MLVDDDAEFAATLADSLVARGVEVQVAHDGASALRFLDEGYVPDVIVCDLMMPGMDGWTFCAERERIPALARIPIVLISANPDVSSLGKLAGIPALVKPFAVEMLLTLVEHARRVVSGRFEKRGPSDK